MDVNYTAWKFWLDIGHWIALIALAIWSYLRTKDNDNDNAVKSVALELATFIKASGKANEDQNNRLTILEESIKHLPTDDEIKQISNDLSAMKSRMDGQSQLLARVEHQTNLIHDHLLNKPR